MFKRFFIILLTLLGCNSKTSIKETNLVQPKVSDGFVNYLDQANTYLLTQQEICKEKYGITNYERWHYDQETGLLEFFNGDTLKVRIQYQSVGTISRVSNTWLWAWANPSTLEHIKQKALEVRQFGKKQGFEPLTKAKWYADEVDGWEMTSIMAYLLQAKGAYRFPTEKTYSYAVFMDIQEIDSAQN